MDVPSACNALETGDFSVPALDRVASAAFNPSDPHRAAANNTLMKLQDNQDLWIKADAIIENATHPQAKFFGVQVLDSAIKTRWKILPSEQKEGIKQFVVGKIISMSQEADVLKREKVFVGKLNLTLVEILKQEWPHNWPSFIPDLVKSSMTNETLCENNMQILKLLSEEVFDFSKDQMVTEKIKRMKESLNTEFTQVYQLCEFVLKNSQLESLLRVTLETLQRFLTWIPLGFIFQTDLIKGLINRFFPMPQLRNEALDCLAEIGSLSGLDAQYDPLFRQLFSDFLTQLIQIFSPETDLQPAFENGTERDRRFLQKLAMFLSGFFKSHLHVMEQPGEEQTLITGMFYLVRVSSLNDVEIFRICLEAWYMLAEGLFKAEYPDGFQHPSNGGLRLNGSLQAQQVNSRKEMYSPVLNSVRQVMIANMAKPEEVLIVEDENGDIVRETAKDLDVIAQYNTMKETLVFLTHLSCEDTETIMRSKLNEQVDGSKWSWDNVSRLCWAIGSISGAMAEDDEKRFLVIVIKDLLGLVEQKRGKDNKAVVASNIMYVVGQYPRFLRAHWKFLKTVVNKLFEFMHELHPGVQDMACDTFLKIAGKCKRKFVTIQTEERVPFVCELVDGLGGIISDLEPHQIEKFYEAVATMLSDSNHTDSIDRQVLLEKLMMLPNQSWQNIMNRAKANVEALADPATIKEIIKILKTNNRVCFAIGSVFTHQLRAIFHDMLNVYQVYSERIAVEVQTHGEIATKMSLVRTLRGAKKEVLRLLNVFINKSGPPEADPLAVVQSFIPHVLDPILGDYKRTVADARDAEVLRLFTTVVKKLKNHVINDVPRIMDAVFEVTLTMITKNFEDYPEHRARFYDFLQAVNKHCFSALFSIPPEHQKLVVHAVVWAMKHCERNISDTVRTLHDDFV